MRSVKAFFTFIFLLVLGGSVSAQILSDWQDRAGLRMSEIYAQAEAAMHQEWQYLEKISAPGRIAPYALDQLAWLQNRQNVEADMLYSGERSPEVTERISQNGNVRGILCYTDVTMERAAKLRFLAEQEESGKPTTLAGKFYAQDGFFVFTPYPFGIPFELGTASQLSKAAPELKALILGQAEQAENAKGLYYLSGFFRLPGVYRLDNSLKAEEITGGMAWREQDRYVAMPEPTPAQAPGESAEDE